MITLKFLALQGVPYIYEISSHGVNLQVVTICSVYISYYSFCCRFMIVECKSLRLIIRYFAPVIKTNVQARIQTDGVDDSREGRRGACVVCCRSLLGVSNWRQIVCLKLNVSWLHWKRHPQDMNLFGVKHCFNVIYIAKQDLKCKLQED
jgi:hypothetical protein